MISPANISLLPGLGRAMILAVMMMAIATIARADNDVPLTVSGTRNITFGTLYRSNSSRVIFTSSSSAEFSVSGRQGRNVRLTITFSMLNRNGISLPLTIGRTDCAYSLDNGSTWQQFASGSIYQNLDLPNGTANGYMSVTVLVRVGGTVTASSTQQRGTYSGQVTIDATYL